MGEGGSDFVGVAAFNAIFDSFCKRYNKSIDCNQPDFKESPDIQKVQETIELVDKYYGHSISRYFQSMLNILGFLNEKEGVLEPVFYIKVLLSQMSKSEVSMLFYYGLIDNELKYFIELYSLLRVVELTDASIPLKECYSNKAFAEVIQTQLES